MDTVTLFGCGMVAVLAGVAFVAHWFGRRFARMLFTSSAVACFSSLIVYLVGLPKPTVTVVTSVTCSVLFVNLVNGSGSHRVSPHERWSKRRAEKRRAKLTEKRLVENAAAIIERAAATEKATRLAAEAAQANEEAARETGDQWERELDVALHR